jgi:hypothetical protein
VIDVTDEVLGAVDDEVPALLHGAGLHTAQIGTGLQRAQQLLGQHAGSFDFLLVRIQLLLHKIARGRDNHLLLFAEGKIHKLPLRAPRSSHCAARRASASRVWRSPRSRRSDWR